MNGWERFLEWEKELPDRFDRERSRKGSDYNLHHSIVEAIADEIGELFMSYYLLNTDGGMVTDGRQEKGAAPGEAAIAVVLARSHNGKERLIDGFSGSIGHATKDEAEYRALIEGLRFSLEEHRATHIRVFVDAEYIADHLNEKAVVSEGLKDLHGEATELLRRFDDYRISWVPRERNQLADSLVRSILYPG